MRRRIDDYQGLDDTLSGTPPEPVNPGGRLDLDRILTTSGEAPSGGIPVGGEADRIQPSLWARRHGSAAGILPDVEDLEGF